LSITDFTVSPAAFSKVQAVLAEQLLDMVDEIALQLIETANTAKLELNCNT
jgi:hypothetical protein